MNKLYHRLFYFFMVLLIACSKKSTTNILTPPPGGVNIYATGSWDSNGNKVLRYWKNGIPVILTNSAKLSDANSISTSGIVVSGNDVYVCGNDFNEYSKTSAATYWKNGVLVEVGDTSKNSFANSIAVSGADVYVAGYEEWYNAISQFTFNQAVYWKNGSPVILGDTLSNSIAQSIFVAGNDVYVVGTWNSEATLWKNGKPSTFADSSMYGSALSILVLGNGIYPVWVGENNSGASAIYGGNGLALNLQAVPGLYTEVTSIAVEGNDIYASGYNTSNSAFASFNAMYWKNGTAVILTDKDASYNNATSVAVSGNDVYVGGNEFALGGVIWKNGVAAVLPQSTSISAICLSYQ